MRAAAGSYPASYRIPRRIGGPCAVTRAYVTQVCLLTVDIRASPTCRHTAGSMNPGFGMQYAPDPRQNMSSPRGVAICGCCRGKMGRHAGERAGASVCKPHQADVQALAAAASWAGTRCSEASCLRCQDCCRSPRSAVGTPRSRKEATIIRPRGKGEMKGYIELRK